MERIFTATDDGYYFVPKKAMGPTVKSAPGNHHDEIEGNPLLERRVGAEPEKEYRARALKPPSGMTPTGDTPITSDEYRECVNCGDGFDVDPRRKSDMCSKCMREAYPRYYASAADAKQARQPMQDDAGATTGLRRRPDYGESDSHTSELNRANSKGASAQYVIALAATSRKEASKTATMYVTGIEWDGLKVASFKFGSDVSKAVRLPNLTAKAVSQQLFAPPFEVKARPVSTASLQSK